MNENFDINGHIRKSLEGFDVQPRITSFDAILQRIQKRKKRRFFIIFFLGLLGVILSTVYFLDPSSVTREPENFKAQSTSAIKDPKTKKDLPVTLYKKASSGEKIQVSKTSSDISNKRNQKKMSINAGSNSTKRIDNNTITNQSFPETTNAFSPGNTGAFSIPQPMQVETATTHLPAQSGTATTQSHVSIEIITTQASENAPGTSRLASEPTVMTSDTELIDNVPFVFLEPKSFILQDTVSYELMNPLTKLTEERQVPGKKILKKKRRFSLLVGLNYNPQWSSYIFSENKQRSKIYDSNNGEPFSKLYLKNRKEQNSFAYNHSRGLKLGVLYNDCWEFWFAIGRQYYEYSEALYTLTTPSKNPTTLSHPPAKYFLTPTFTTETTFKNTYMYSFYAFEINRIIRKGRSLRFKFGLGLRVNNLLITNYVFANAPDEYYSFEDGYIASRKMYTINLNGGIMKDLAKWLQLRISPALFYSPTSFFNNTYVIKQKSYGLEMECMLLFKLF